VQLNHSLHLAYCTNIHRGETWAETLEALERYTLAVRERVCPNQPYAIGLRLSNEASLELAEPPALNSFVEWLRDHNCYVFTINGFPYGKFHGTRVKEQVYAPDWTTRERLDFTNRLFDILARLVPEGVEGSVSTVPCSFKEFISGEEQVAAMRANLWRCIEHMAQLSQRVNRKLHLGLEPEPLCFLETTDETVAFFRQMAADRPDDNRLHHHLGVNYDTCHLAVEFEDAEQSLSKLRRAGIKISKIHVSSALKVRPVPEVRKALLRFAEGVYFHQVIERRADGTLHRYRDLDVALQDAECRMQDAECRGEPPKGGTPSGKAEAVEWRIHFHIPLHSTATPFFDNTSDHILSVFATLEKNPALCSHLEMETYTWEVLPAELKNRSVVDQLVSEYDWTLARLREHGLGT
jgi:hypothetical protein